MFKLPKLIIKFHGGMLVAAICQTGASTVIVLLESDSLVFHS